MKKILIFSESTRKIPDKLRTLFSKEELNDLVFNIPSRLKEENLNKIREVAIYVRPVEKWTAPRKDRENLFYCDNNKIDALGKERYYGWAKSLGVVEIEITPVNENTLWTVRNFDFGEELVYYEEPDHDGYLKRIFTE